MCIFRELGANAFIHRLRNPKDITLVTDSDRFYVVLLSGRGHKWLFNRSPIPSIKPLVLGNEMTFLTEVHMLTMGAKDPWLWVTSGHFVIIIKHWWTFHTVPSSYENQITDRLHIIRTKERKSCFNLLTQETTNT